MPPLLDRYRAIAQLHGSTARTPAGVLRYITTHAVPLCPVPSAPDVGANRTQTRDAYAAEESRTRWDGARVPPAHSCTPTPAQASLARVLAGASARDPVPVETCGAWGAPSETGVGYSFRWRGRWKSAPGSYIPSTRRVQAGQEWVRETASVRLSRVDGVRTWYLPTPVAVVHGIAVHRAWTVSGACWWVRGLAGHRGAWAVHTDAAQSLRAAVREALRALRRRRRAEAAAEQREADLRDSRQRATIATAQAAGYCLPGIRDWCRWHGVRPARAERGIPVGVLVRRWGRDYRIRAIAAVALRTAS